MAIQGEGKTFYEHPDYKANLDYFEAIELFLRPTQEIKHPDYLWPHSFEQPERQLDVRDQLMSVADRSLREQRTEYINYLSMVANRITSLVVKGGINFSKDIKDIFEDNKDNVDGCNNNLETFFAQCFLDDISFGAAYCLVNTSTNLAVTSLGDELNNPEIRPYFVRLHPMIVKDWQLANDGSFREFRYEYEVLEPRESLAEEPALTRYSEVWSGDGSQVQVSKYVSVDKENKIINYFSTKPEKHNYWLLKEDPIQIIGLEELPVSILKSKTPWLKDVLPIVKKIYNKQSDMDNIIYSQGYDKTFISADLDNATKSDGKPMSAEEKIVKIAHNSVTIIPMGSQVTRLDPTVPEAMFRSIAEDLISLFQIAFNMLRVSPPDSKMGEAADARRELKEDLLTRINEKRAQYVSFMRKSIANYARYQNRSQTYISEAEFVKPLDQTDLAELITFVRQISDRLERYPLWEKEVDKRLAQEMALPNEDKILGEIEATDLVAIREEEQAALTESITGLVNTKSKPK